MNAQILFHIRGPQIKASLPAASTLALLMLQMMAGGAEQAEATDT
jgi:hypothetical protein